MQEEQGWQRVVKFTAFIIAIIAIVIILKTLKGIFVPLVLAIFLSYLFAPVVEFLAKIKVPRVISLFIILAVIGIGSKFLVETLIKNARDFLAFYPTLENELVKSIIRFLRNYLNIEARGLSSILQSGRVRELLNSALSISWSFVVKFLLTFLILIFIYLGYGTYPKLIKKAFNPKQLPYIFDIMKHINEQITNYFLIKTLISVGTGVLTGIACAVLGIKFSVLWGFLAFLLNYIPYIGSFFAVILPCILAFFQFPNSFIPLIAFGVLLVIQLFMGNYLDPEMMGNKFNLSPIVIIISLFFWSYVWGIAGAFLAVPITAMIKIIIQNIEPLRPIAVLMSKRAD
jgi:predicted PurR-regulated permease PerM